MIDFWKDFPDDISEDWRLEIIHDYPDRRNSSIRDKWARDDTSWIIGMYKDGTVLNGLIFEVLICYKGDKLGEYYAKIKVELDECAFARTKGESNLLHDHRNLFLKKWKNEFESSGWKEAGTAPASKSVSVMTFKDDFQEILYALIELAETIDRDNWT
jgi:hypothetical protein